MPSLIVEIRPFHDGPGLDRELFTVFLLPATIWHGLVLATGLDIDRPAFWASQGSVPALLDKPGFRRGRIGEHLEHSLE